MVLAPEHPLVDVIVRATSGPATTSTTGRARARRVEGHVRPDGTPGRRRRAATASSRREVASSSARPEGREKTGVFTGAFAINPTNDAAHPDLHRRLRADGLRHRRDHGRARARRARLRVRARSSSSADRPRHPAARRVAASTASTPTSADVARGVRRRRRRDDLDQRASRSTASTSPTAKQAITEWLEQRGRRRADRHLQAARLAVQPAALLG